MYNHQNEVLELQNLEFDGDHVEALSSSTPVCSFIGGAIVGGIIVSSISIFC